MTAIHHNLAHLTQQPSEFDRSGLGLKSVTQYLEVLNMAQARKNWTPLEDKAIKTLVSRYGTKNWALISQKLSNKSIRTGKQCRERWHNHLKPSVNKQKWTDQDQQKMFQAHQRLGNKWTLIAELLQGRTDNDVKNHFYSMFRRGLRRVSKMLGKKNSTRKIKVLKPAVLSRVFQSQGKDNTDQLPEQFKKTAQALFELSMAQTITNSAIKIDSQDQRRFEELIQRLIHQNQEYEVLQKSKKVAKDQIQKKYMRTNHQSQTESFIIDKRCLRNHQTSKDVFIQTQTSLNICDQIDQPIQEEIINQNQAANPTVEYKGLQLLPEVQEYDREQAWDLRLDSFEDLSLNKLYSTDSNDSFKLNKTNHLFNFSPRLTPSSQLSLGFSNIFSTPSSLTSNWTPLHPTPSSEIFPGVVDLQLKGNNQYYDSIMHKMKRDIQKNQTR